VHQTLCRLQNQQLSGVQGVGQQHMMRVCLFINMDGGGLVLNI